MEEPSVPTIDRLPIPHDPVLADKLGLRKPWRNKVTGNVHFDSIAAQTGLYTYYDEDGTKILSEVTLDTLRDSAPGLRTVSITLDHPDEFLDEHSDPSLRRGHVSDAVIHEIPLEDGESKGYLVARCVVHDAELQGIVLRGEVTETSPGYLVATGPSSDARADEAQVARSYNHYAFVDRARGGADCAIRIDGLRMQSTQTLQEKPMPVPKRKDGDDIEDRGAVLAALEDISTRLGRLEAGGSNEPPLADGETDPEEEDMTDPEEIHADAMTRVAVAGLAEQHSIPDIPKTSTEDLAVAVVAKLGATVKRADAVSYCRVLAETSTKRDDGWNSLRRPPVDAGKHTDSTASGNGRGAFTIYDTTKKRAQETNELARAGRR